MGHPKGEEDPDQTQLRHNEAGSRGPHTPDTQIPDSRVGVLGAGVLLALLGLPALVAVDELRQVGRLLGVADDELVL